MVLMSKGSLSMSELASTLCVSPSATTQLLDGLVERDFVKREPDEVDRRIVRVTVSAKGKQYLSQTRGKGVDRFMSMFDVLNDSELEQIESITQKLTHVKSGTSK